jgi:hypothetical protein
MAIAIIRRPCSDSLLSASREEAVFGSDNLPGDLKTQIEAFVADYNNLRYNEGIDNPTPADVYFGRGQTILIERERIKRQTIANRRLLHQQKAA